MSDRHHYISMRYDDPEGEALTQAIELKQKDGRLTLNEATSQLKEGAGEFINLYRAAKAGEIPTYAPGSCKPLGIPEPNLLYSDDREEVYPDDLNAWLDEKYPRVKFHFKTGSGRPEKEPPEQRRRRLQATCDQKRNDGVRGWKKKTAAEENISVSMLDRILRRGKSKKGLEKTTLEKEISKASKAWPGLCQK